MSGSCDLLLLVLSLLLVGDTNARVGNGCDSKMVMDMDSECTSIGGDEEEDEMISEPRALNEDATINCNDKDLLMWAKDTEW